VVNPVFGVALILALFSQEKGTEDAFPEDRNANQTTKRATPKYQTKSTTKYTFF